MNQITTQSTTYNLQYDEFGNASGVTAGGNILATYEYYPKNGKLWKINYGNGFSEKYYYNNLEMLSDICYTYSDGTSERAYSYSYNSDGTLRVLTDHLTGKKILYNYDSRGRITSIYEKGATDTSSKMIYRAGYVDNKLAGYTNYFSYTAADSVVTRPITTSYNYNTKGYLSTENHQYLGLNHNINYTYDNFGRISSVHGNLGTFQHTEQYTYVSEGNNTSYLVDSYTSTVNGTSKNYTYTYDSKGNITQLNDGIYTTTYAYDDLGQLIYENYSGLPIHLNYYYDNAGNIIERVRTLTILNQSTQYITNYEYSSSNWGDLLTSYDGHAITYDEIGNPLSYYNGSTYTFTWMGRQLTGAVEGSNTMSFTYNDEGIRTSKTVNGVTHTYKLNGSQIIAESWDDKLLYYLYDSSGSPIGMMYRQTDYTNIQWDTYWFEKNLQGDIVAVFTASGIRLATYTYDAWGECTVSYFNGGDTTAAQYNPFRYRGYYYDTDLGMYYLQSRYYDPNTCRFISPDSVSYLGANGDLTSYNLYAYCGNNPVNYVDPNGHSFWAIVLIGALVGMVSGFIATACVDSADDGEAFNGSVDKNTYIANTVIGGALGAGAGGLASVAAPLLTGSAMSGFAYAFAGGGAASVVSIAGSTILVSGAAIIGISLFANRSDKEKSTEHPSWVNPDMVNPNLTPQENAKNILNNRYGEGNWKMGPKTEYSQIVKWITRKVFYYWFNKK